MTEVGLAFLAKATRILDELEELNDIARPGTKTLSGHLRLSAPTTLGVRRLPLLIAKFAKAHPDVTVELNLSDRSVDLIAEGYDLALRVAELKPSSLIARRVGVYNFVCCASPEYLDRHGVPVHPIDLERHRCVLSLNLIPRNRWIFYAADGEQLSADVESNIAIDNGEAMRLAALEGAGVIYAPRILVEADLEAGALCEVLGQWPKLTLPIHIVHPSRRFVPRRVTAFIDMVSRDLKM